MAGAAQGPAAAPVVAPVAAQDAAPRGGFSVWDSAAVQPEWVGKPAPTAAPAVMVAAPNTNDLAGGARLVESAPIRFERIQDAAKEKSSSSATSDGLRFELTPYLWFASIDGNVTIGPATGNVHEAFGELLSDLDGAAAAHLEVWYGKVGVMLDGLYMSLGADSTLSNGGPSVAVTTSFQMFQSEGFLAYRIYEDPTTGRFEPFHVDLYGGVRYTRLETHLSGAGAGAIGLTGDLDNVNDWFDPVVGLRVKSGLTDWLSLGVRGDIGRFDIGDAARFTYKTTANLQFHLFSWLSIDAAYQVYGLDRQRSAGAQTVGFDGIMYGPILGVTFSF